MTPILSLLSVTAAASPADGSCDLHYRWNDGSESSANQNDVLGVYTASAQHRASKGEYPHTNSQEWCAWALDYANRYDAHHGAPPAGFVAPAVEVVEAPLFPTAAVGVPPVTDPRAIRRAALEAMDPVDYKAAAKAVGVVASKLKKAALVEAILAAEFDKPAAEVAPEPQAAPAVVEAPVVAAEPVPAAKPAKAKKEKVAKAVPVVVEAPVIVAEPVAPVPEVAAPEAEDEGWTESDIRLQARNALVGTAAESVKKLGALAPEDDDLPVLDVLQAALVLERAEKRPRLRVIAAIEARIATFTAAPAGDIVAPAPGIVDGEVRPEVGEEGLGGSGVEMGGGMGLGGGVELGGSIGSQRGAGELTGGLTGESSAGMGGEGRDATPGGIKHRSGAGCKQPDKVDGWEAGRVLVVLKPHRGEHKDWGTCEYRVKCEDDGTYTLVKLTGNRKASDLGGLFEGKHWDYVSPMLTDLMGIPRDPAGKPAFHHRMTIRRWFALGRSA